MVSPSSPVSYAKKSTAGVHYFLADNSLTWRVIGLAMFAAKISTVHLASQAQSTYTSGLLYGNYEWMAGFTLILLPMIFAPLYLRTRVPPRPTTWNAATIATVATPSS